MSIENELDELYQELILDHYRRPRNTDLLPDAQHHAEGFNPFCGDQVNLQIMVDAGGTIEAVGHQGKGCSISQASASMLSEAIAGQSLEEIDSTGELFRNMMAGPPLSGGSLERLEGLTALSDVRKVPVRIKCALLAWSALEEAIEDYRKRH